MCLEWKDKLQNCLSLCFDFSIFIAFVLEAFIVQLELSAEREAAYSGDGASDIEESVIVTEHK